MAKEISAELEIKEIIEAIRSSANKELVAVAAISYAQGLTAGLKASAAKDNKAMA